MKYTILLGILSLTVFVSCQNAGGRQLAGGRNAIDLTDPTQIEKIDKLSKYGVGTIAARRMEAAKLANGVSSTTNKTLSYNHRVVSAESQVVAGENKNKIYDENLQW